MKLDLSNVKTDENPAEGEYGARITNAEIKDSKAGGQYLSITVHLDGVGRPVFDTFMLSHSNPKAVSVGLGRLKTLLKAANYKNPDCLEDIWELNGLSFIAKIKLKTDDFGEKATISAYKPVNQAKTTTAAGPAKDMGNIPNF